MRLRVEGGLILFRLFVCLFVRVFCFVLFCFCQVFVVFSLGVLLSEFYGIGGIAAEGSYYRNVLVFSCQDLC